MADKAELDPVLLIETEARKAPPLTYVLLLYAILLCPIWISAVVVAFVEHLSASLPDSFYAKVRLTEAGGMIVSFVLTLLATKRAVRWQIEQAAHFDDLSSFRLGWGALRAAEQDWWSAVLVMPMILYVAAGRDIFALIFGVDRAELTESERYWFALIWVAVISGLIFCFLGFCAWLGHRVKKQRSAKRVLA